MSSLSSGFPSFPLASEPRDDDTVGPALTTTMYRDSRGTYILPAVSASCGGRIPLSLTTDLLLGYSPQSVSDRRNTPRFKTPLPCHSQGHCQEPTRRKAQYHREGNPLKPDIGHLESPARDPTSGRSMSTGTVSRDNPITPCDVPVDSGQDNTSLHN